MSKKDTDTNDKSTIIENELFKARTIMIFGEINMRVAEKVSAQLISMSHASKEPIKILINSPGGHVESGDTIHDMIRFIDAPIHMIGTGWVASAGALIFLGASKENRYCLPNTRFLLHQPSGGMQGVAEDIAIQAEEIMKMKERLNQIISQETGTPVEKVRKDTERDYWLTPSEAISYGLVKKVIKMTQDIG